MAVCVDIEMGNLQRRFGGIVIVSFPMLSENCRGRGTVTYWFVAAQLGAALRTAAGTTRRCGL